MAELYGDDMGWIDWDELMSLVERIARRILRRFGREVPYEDLVSYGVAGCLEAARRYDPSLGIDLACYAYGRIYGSMVDGARRWNQTREVIARNKPRNGGEGQGEAPLARGTQCQQQWFESGGRTVSLDNFVTGDRTLGGAIHSWACDAFGRVGEPADGFLDALGERQQLGELMNIIATMPKKERRLLEMYYVEGRTMNEIASEMGVTKGWVSRLHTESLNKLRARLLLRRRPGAVLA